MLHMLRRDAACCVVALTVLSMTPYPASRVSGDSGAVAAWAMAGHDPQRTAQGVAIGPQRATPPHLVRSNFESTIIGRDSMLYGTQARPLAAGRVRVLAVYPSGQVRWAAITRSPVVALAADGTVFTSGGSGPCLGLALRSVATLTTPSCLAAFTPTGQVRWHIVTQYLTKRIPKLLVRPDGSVVRAIVGPGGYPITVYSPRGVPRPLGAACSWAATALGENNQLYAVTYDNGTDGVGAGLCPAYDAYPRRNGSSVVAFTRRGTRAWMTPLPVTCAATSLMVDARRRRLYAAALCGQHGSQQHTWVYALDARGQRLWAVKGPGTGNSTFPTLALDRTSGGVWLATTAGLQRFSPSGAVRWRRTWHATSAGDSGVTLALDAQGTAYVCGGDGLLRAISAAGQVLWQYQFKVHRQGFSVPPSAALGPDGKLYISNDDGVVYFAP